MEIDKAIISNKVVFASKGFKCLIDYKDNEKVKQLCIILPKTSRYTKRFDETKYMTLFIKYDELLEKYNKNWDEVSNSIKKHMIVNWYTMKSI